MNPDTWLLFALAYLATTLSPGPNVLLVIRNTLQHGNRAGWPTIAGNLLAQLMVIVLIAGGVGAVLAHFPPFFTAMKLIGGLYLVVIGWRQMRGAGHSAAGNTPSTPAVTHASPRSLRSLFGEAFLVSASNPKTLLFLTAFLPQFIDHQHPLGMQFSLMYLTIACTVLSVHWFYARSAQHLRRDLRQHAMGAWLKRLVGTLFIGLGLRLALSQQS